MADEILSNNPGDSAPAAAPAVTAEPKTMAEAANQADTAIKEAQAKQDGAPAETAKEVTPPQKEEAKPEFSDPNMQAKFTQRMQELSEKEKSYQEGLRKSQAYDELLKNQEVVSYLRKVYLGQEEKKDEISDDDFLAVTSDKNKFNEFLKNTVQQVLEERTRPLETKVKEMSAELQESRIIQDIDDFANAKDNSGNSLHADFDELNEAGKIQPYLVKFAGSRLPELEKIEMAYKLAKAENITQEVAKKAHDIVQQKKQAIGERGNSAQSNLSQKKFASMKEFAETKAKELGIEVP
jgi:hypothetical protein